MHSVFVVACCVSQLLAADPEPTTLIQEPSFEGVAGDSGLPAGWFGIHSHPDGKYRFELVEGGRTGKKSLFMEGTGGYGVTWGEKLPIDAM